MRKAAILCAGCLLLLAGCGSAAASSEPVSEAAPVVAASPAPTVAPAETPESTSAPEPVPTETPGRSDNLLMNASVSTAPVMNGAGTAKIGERATAWFDAAGLANISEAQFSEFVAARVEGQSYSWFTLDLNDGTGIVFNGCGTIVADYGYLDDVGRVEESLGTVTLEESGYTYTANLPQTKKNAARCKQATFLPGACSGTLLLQTAKRPRRAAVR